MLKSWNDWMFECKMKGDMKRKRKVKKEKRKKKKTPTHWPNGKEKREGNKNTQSWVFFHGNRFSVTLSYPPIHFHKWSVWTPDPDRYWTVYSMLMRGLCAGAQLPLKWGRAVTQSCRDSSWQKRKEMRNRLSKDCCPRMLATLNFVAL